MGGTNYCIQMGKQMEMDSIIFKIILSLYIKILD